VLSACTDPFASSFFFFFFYEFSVLSFSTLVVCFCNGGWEVH
jgi:hypothetical protein